MVYMVQIHTLIHMCGLSPTMHCTAEEQHTCAPPLLRPMAASQGSCSPPGGRGRMGTQHHHCPAPTRAGSSPHTAGVHSTAQQRVWHCQSRRRSPPHHHQTGWTRCTRQCWAPRGFLVVAAAAVAAGVAAARRPPPRHEQTAAVCHQGQQPTGTSTPLSHQQQYQQYQQYHHHHRGNRAHHSEHHPHRMLRQG